MEKKKMIPYNGRQVAAVLVAVNQSNERWNDYLLDDGSTIRIKVIVNKVYRVDSERTPEGDPVYVVQSQNFLSTEVPEELRQN